MSGTVFDGLQEFVDAAMEVDEYRIIEGADDADVRKVAIVCLTQRDTKCRLGVKPRRKPKKDYKPL